MKCEAGAVNGACPVCKNDLTGCTGKSPDPVPESGVTITIKAPSGWATKRAEAVIRITDDTGNGFESAKVKIEKNGNWQDITDALEKDGKTYEGTAELSENCTLYVSVTGKDGKTYEKSRYIECFDRTAPTLRASVDGRLLRAEADDDLSGVAAIYVDGEKFTDLTNGTLDVRLRDLDCEFEQISVQAVDEAGNKSKTVQVKNPDYEKEQEKEQDSGKDSGNTSNSEDTKEETKPEASDQKPASSAGDSTQKPEQAASAAGSSTPSADTSKPAASASTDPEQTSDTEPHDPTPLTPDGQGTVVDNATDEDGKEFYTISTPDENIFYLVIDKQRDSDNVYFLNAVTEQDLMALAQKEEDSQESAVPDPEPVCDCKEKCAPGEVNTDCPVCISDLERCAGEEPEPEPAADEPQEEPEQSGGGAGTLIFVLLAALAVGGAGYYFKIYRPKQELDDAEDFDELTGADEETFVNEDELPEKSAEQEQPEESSGWPDTPEEPAEPFDEPDYPDSYDNAYEDGEPEEGR